MDFQTKVNEIIGMDISKYIDMIIKGTINYLPNIIGAIIVLWIGFKIVNIINKWIEKIMKKAKWDPMLESFISSLVSILLKVLVFISAAGIVGVETSSFVAMLAAAGLAIGMALSGTLQNFAGGVMILIFKPYKIGDYIEVNGYAGTVKEIAIFNTILTTLDKKKVIIPNSDIVNGTMTNYSSEPKRRIDFIIGVSYTDDIDKVKKTLLEIATKNKKILQNETITIGLIELADSSVNFAFRFFVKRTDYLNTKFEVLEQIKKTFDKKGISFPFPQRDVNIYNHVKSKKKEV